MYNRKYFEQNRPNQDWNELPDLFTEECPPEIKPYLQDLLEARDKKKAEEEAKKK